MSLTHRGDDGGEGLAATEHSNYEPNSSVFSSSMGTHSRSVVDAAKHYKIRELVIKQQEKYALQHGGHSAKYMPSPQYGSSSGKTSGMSSRRSFL